LKASDDEQPDMKILTHLTNHNEAICWGESTFRLVVLCGSVINGNSMRRNTMTDFATANNDRNPLRYLKSHSVITRLKQTNCRMEPVTYRIERGTTDRHGIGKITRTYLWMKRKKVELPTILSRQLLVPAWVTP
jgi:hypothetical protein